ncbi:MAG: hypothetical protein IKJ88_08835 [Clostridia bacterium]|nr:hypothetical protein [Clostridia bacterium]MBR3975952.1 hypothetical protein [Clostridia bacterium]
MNERSFETLLYGITANTVAKIMEINNWSEDIAMERFTSSKLYSFLEREETKVWQYSALMLAQLFNEERSGRFALPEV